MIIFCITFALIFILWGVVFLKYAGTKYMSRMILTEHPENYSLRRFKIVYAGCLFVMAGICVLTAVSKDYSCSWLFPVPVVIAYVMFYTWCKKKI